MKPQCLGSDRPTKRGSCLEKEVRGIIISSGKHHETFRETGKNLSKCKGAGVCIARLEWPMTLSGLLHSCGAPGNFPLQVFFFLCCQKIAADTYLGRRLSTVPDSKRAIGRHWPACRTLKLNEGINCEDGVLAMYVGIPSRASSLAFRSYLEAIRLWLAQLCGVLIGPA